MDRKELIKKYLEFFKSKGHKIIPSASLVPENDPTVLFTTAGMHPLVPYLLGEKHPLGKRLVNVQKCVRTGDIDEVGDSTHHTFFEMLGNWSLGDYWKKEAIQWSFEFLTKVLKIPTEKLAVTVFIGDENAPRDDESAKLWISLGIPKERIAYLGKEDNWWGPAGKTGPCGSDTEMFYWKPEKIKPPKIYNPQDKNWVEIGNDVFMQYVKDKRVILVDGMYCLYDENFKLKIELLDIINNLNSHYVLVVNKFREKGRELVKNYDQTKDTNWETFSLEEKGIKKDNPEYFKNLLKKFNLIPEEVIYFDHDKNNVETAKKLGILSKHYTDIKTIKKFIEDNLLAFLPAKQKNVDTGMGVERSVAVLNGFDDNYLTDLWIPIIKEIERLSKKKYGENKEQTKVMRIIADHIKAAVFLFDAGVSPGHKERGYVLKRLIRRTIVYGKKLGLRNFTSKVAQSVFEIYPDYFPKKGEKIRFVNRGNRQFILNEIDREEAEFNYTIEKGLKVLRNMIAHNKTISPTDAFLLFQSYGFPVELTQEIAKDEGLKIDVIKFVRDFEQELKKHQQLSRTASKGKFMAGLADTSEQSTKYHTATHLLHASLKKILGNEVQQMGSNITQERLRFDFNFQRKLTENEIKKVESIVNEQIKKCLPVSYKEMPYEKAVKEGALSYFKERYPEIVKVYSVGNFSKEICTGPHVKNTKELGRFKIIKEESVAQGVRRIKAVLE